MANKCDHKSVGILVWQGSNLLMIERKKFPFGFAPPAGHVDNRISFEIAAREELREETGLRVLSLTLWREGRKDTPCQREGGSWHYWKIYTTEAAGRLILNIDEAKQALWASKEEIAKLAKRTEQYFKGDVIKEKRQKNPGLEAVWYQWFKEGGIL